jgi:hypothetical protein
MQTTWSGNEEIAKLFLCENLRYVSPGRLFANPDCFPQKWQTNGNNSQARARLRH